MKQGKYANKNAARKSSKKLAVLLLALVLLIGATIGGTLAYLTDVTDAKTNTFVVGNVGDLDLVESPTDYAYKTTAGEYIIIPGVDITKDPTVTFSGNNIAAYVFVKVEATGWTFAEKEGVYTYTKTDDENGKMEWTVATGWNAVSGNSGVYYREVAANAAAGEWPVINGNLIDVNEHITNDTIGDYASSLVFTAYAIQKDGFAGETDPVAAAWSAVSN